MENTVQFAVNYSPASLALLEEGRIEVDLLKCPAWPDVVTEVRDRCPCYVHLPFRAGRDELNDVDWDEVDSMLDGTATRYVNAHLAPCASDFDGLTLMARGGRLEQRIIDAMKRDAETLVDRFGREHVILGNVMWDPLPPWEIPALALDCDVIREVVHDVGCSFLLDLAHVRVTTLQMGCDLRDYVAALPLRHLREVHITGTVREEDGLWRDHHPLGDEDWPILDWALEQIRSGAWGRPWLVTFEYGGIGSRYEKRSDPAVVAEQVPLLYKRVKSIP